jgi:hypothetical protein
MNDDIEAVLGNVTEKRAALDEINALNENLTKANSNGSFLAICCVFLF